MLFHWTLYACLFLALWSAIIGGVFSAFSEFVMAGLLRAKPAAGIAVMQHINHTVLKTQFVAGILLIAPMSLALAGYGFTALQGLARISVLLAAFIYLPSVFFMTIFGNVPMNNKLEELDAEAEESAAYWQYYGRVWTRLNHVRTLGSVATACAYLVASIALIASNQV